MPKAYAVEVIITDLTVRGKGTDDDPLRRILQVWQKDGVLIAERDEWTEKGKG